MKKETKSTVKSSIEEIEGPKTLPEILIIKLIFENVHEHQNMKKKFPFYDFTHSYPDFLKQKFWFTVGLGLFGGFRCAFTL
jgi:hypothetical protein